MATNTEKLSVAALISVILRRKVNRTIDVKWLVENDAYAQEIIGLCRQQGMPDLAEYADHLEQLIFGKSAVPLSSNFAPTETQRTKAFINEVHKQEFTEEPIEPDPDDEATPDPSKYVGGLR